MASIFGRELLSSEEVRELREAAGELKLARREMEDLGWTLLNGDFEGNLGDLPPLERNKLIVKGVKFWLSDPQLGALVDMYTDYVIGTGIQMPHTDNDKLAEVISRFWGDPENKLMFTTMEAQQQKLAELQIFGNIFPLAFVDTGTGHVRFSDVPPTEMKDIITDPNNRKKHVFYKRVSVPRRYNFTSETYESGTPQTTYYRSWRFRPDKVAGEPDFGPSDRQVSDEGDNDEFMFHWSINRLSDGKFGHPRTARSLEWVRAYNEFSKSRISIMRALAKFAWNRKIKGSGKDVNKIANNLIDGNMSEGGGFTPPPPQYAATITTNEGVSWEQLKTDTGGASAMQDGRMIKAQIGVGGGFPLHYLGDVGSANLATASSLELPVLKLIESMQGRLESWYRDIIDFVIDNAIKYGDLPALSEGRFTIERVNERLRGEYHTGRTKPKNEIGEAGEIETKVDAETKDGDRNEYEYRLVMPSIMKRQISETINAAVNVVKSIDPYSQNVEASRWLLEFVLEVMSVPNPKGIANKIFPEGFEYPKDVADVDGDGNTEEQIETERGRTDQLAGDGRGIPDFKKSRRPTSEQETGFKGRKRTRQIGELNTAASMAEAAMLDLIDGAMDRIDEETGNGSEPPADS